jgi:hypothetical protein
MKNNEGDIRVPLTEEKVKEIMMGKGNVITMGSRRVREIMREKQRQERFFRERNQERVFAKRWNGEPNGNKRDISTILQSSAWSGKRCFILAGGPSLTDHDLSLLDDELTIGINRVYEIFTPTIFFAMDKRFHNWIYQGKYGEKVKEKYINFPNIKLYLDVRNMDLSDIFYVRSIGRCGLSFDLASGLYNGNNSGYGAFNLACALGANPIYLLGYDMKFKDGKKHYHNGHPTYFKDTSCFHEKMMQSFGTTFMRTKDIVAQKGIKVINVNTDSNLKAFPLGELPKNLPGKKKPIFVSYYTKDTGYEKEVVRFRDSIWKHFLRNEIKAIDDLGTWIQNVQYKANFLKEMLLKHPGRPVVWVDCDAEIKSDPILFNNIRESFACHFRKRTHRTQYIDEQGELLSGTLYFKNNKKSLKLINLWIEENERAPNMWDQQTLRRAWNRWDGSTCKLPAEYCCIFDSPERRVKEPVIEHFQASRRYKKRK